MGHASGTLDELGSGPASAGCDRRSSGDGHVVAEADRRRSLSAGG